MSRMWTVDDVMSYLQVTRTTVDRLVGHGEFPRPVRVGPHLLRWRQTDIARWESRLAPASPDAGPVRVVFTQRFIPYKVGDTAEFSEQEAAILLIEGVAQLVNDADCHRIADIKSRLIHRREELLGDGQTQSIHLGLLKDWNGIGRAVYARDAFRDETRAPQVQVRFLKDWEEWKAGKEYPMPIERAATLCIQEVVELANRSNPWSLMEELIRGTTDASTPQN